MKTFQNITRGATLLFILLAHGTYAQYYQLDVRQETYSSLVQPSYVISDSTVLTDSLAYIHHTPANLEIHAFGVPITGILEAGRDGYLAALSDTSDFVFDPFFTGLRSNGRSEFRASYVLDGRDSVLEFEWYQFGIQGRPDADFITFKARIYVTSEIIEFHYGPSFFSPTPVQFTGGPYVTLLHANKGFASFKEQLWLTGSPSNPTQTQGLATLPEFPADGTQYRFSGKLFLAQKTQEFKSKELLVYPNPAGQVVTFESSQQMEEIQWVDLSGRVLVQVKPSADRYTQPLDQLPAGWYLAWISLEDGSKQNKRIQVLH